MATKDEPGSLPEPISVHSRSRSSKKSIFIVLTVILVLLIKFIWHNFDRVHQLPTHDICPQVSELIPEKNYELWESLARTYSTDSFKLKAVNWLSGAIQVR